LFFCFFFVLSSSLFEAGVEPLPYLEIQEVPASGHLPLQQQQPSSNKKRPRDSINPNNPNGLVGGAVSPRKMTSNSHHPEFGQQQHSSSAHNDPSHHNPNNNPNGGHHRLTLESATEIILQRMKEGFDQLGEMIKEYHFSQREEQNETGPQSTLKKAMQELNNEPYKLLMNNASHREKLFLALNDGNTAASFLLYPDSYKLNFLQDLINKHK
jgi:hypothetical protein